MKPFPHLSSNTAPIRIVPTSARGLAPSATGDRPTNPPPRSALFLLALCASFCSLTVSADSPSHKIDFARDIQPILSDSCYHCHGPDAKGRKAKLRLDTREGAFRIKDGKSLIIPGKPGDSELVRRITTPDPDDLMPPPDSNRKLTAAQVQMLKQWVEQGAPWGEHWALIAPKKVAPPAVKNGSWIKNAIDPFVLSHLEAQGVSPSSEATKEALIRRASFDLTGLPPAAAEVDAFIADTSPDAYEKLIDRLLASPRYGERMATDWLDLARYADTHGYQADRYRPVWAYRDWVIKAFNQNLPFDQFATWQIAGDLLPNATKDQRLATAFNRLHNQNEEGGIVEEEYRVAYVVDRVNTFGTAFLGLTFECSRCHDHKYDPISQKDFYSLFAFFQNIDESGQTTYFTDSTPVPTMLLSTDEQDKKLAELTKKMDEAEKALADARAAVRQPEGRKAFDAWYWANWNKKSRPSPTPMASYDFVELKNDRVPNKVTGGKPAAAVEKPKVVLGPIPNVILSGENGFTFPDVGHFSRTDPFSIAINLTPAEVAPRQVVLHHSKAPIDAGSRGYELLLEEGRVAFGLHHMWPGNSLKVRTRLPLQTKVGQPVPAKGGHDVTITYDGSSRAAGVKIYVDSEPQELEIIRDGLTKDITYGGKEPDLALGYRFRDNGFKGGQVRSLEIYDRELMPIEVSHPNGFLSIELGTDKEVDEQTYDYYADSIDPAGTKAKSALRSARAEHAKFINAIPEMMVMKELPQPKPACLLKRGAYDAPGDAVTANTPHALPALSPDLPRNRLGLAQWLIDPANPLMARVTVNRAWQQMFGRGLVETSDNFGKQGSPPTHPELLDFLARIFVDDLHWDTKALLKLIAMSATYRQSSRLTPELVARDLPNDLLARGPARRLTAEMLRDQALAVSGLLVEKQGGPSVKPYQPAGLWEELASGKPNYGQGHGDDLHRRSLYTFWKRTVPPPAMMTFDAADRSYCTARRQSTSTPLQALALLNDVQLVEAARLVSERMLKHGGKTDAERAAWIFKTVTGRKANEKEQAVLLQLLAEQRALFTADPAAARKLLAVGEAKNDPSLDAVELATGAVLAQALLNHDEAIMRR